MTDQHDTTKNAHAVELGRLGGKRGGVARARKLSKEERSAIAQNAAAQRWKDRPVASLAQRRDSSDDDNAITIECLDGDDFAAASQDGSL
jgi:hypothetical protein